jgi:triacylglycerol lipase
MRFSTTVSFRLAALAALTALGACSVDSPTDPLSAGALASRNPRPKKTAHDPILFVHGWNANSSTWTTMISRFKNDGWTDAELANWSYDPNQSNATTAATISAKVDSIIRVTSAAHVDIITHSMGSLSARYYVRSLGGDGKVDALVSLGGPNHGTNTAFFCSSTACVEMRPNSAFITTLNADDETWGTPRYATWWSPCDEVIQPQSSPILDGAANTETACLEHSQLHEDAGVYRQVRDWVKSSTLP